MIDCGEGSQMQLSRYKLKRNKIDHIFISHLHGDHVYGLPGLLTSMSLGGRISKLTVHGPVAIKRFLAEIFRASGAYFSYDLQIIEYDVDKAHDIIINDELRVLAFPMQHRTPTLGYRFDEVISTKNIDPAAIKKYNLSISEIVSIKDGADLRRGKLHIYNELLTAPLSKPRSYAYCSDTVYDIDLVKHLAGTTLLYHETTYLDDLVHLAAERMHSTLGQAIDIAKRAQVSQLITGHYSSRYHNLQIFLQEGISQFAGLLLGEEGRTYPVESNE